MPGIGLTAAGAHARLTGAAGRWPIVAWGDSLTQGSGATDGQDYVTQARALLTPTRETTNRGVGGQTPHAIAARQGGWPITLTLADDAIPAMTGTQHYFWDFADGTTGPFGYTWFGYTASSIVRNVESSLEIVISAPLDGAQAFIGTTTADEIIAVSFDVVAFDFAHDIDIGILGTGWLNGGPQVRIDSVGHYAFEAVSASDANGGSILLGVIYTGDQLDFGTLRIGNVRVTKAVSPAAAVAVTARNLSAVTDQGPWWQGTRMIHGSLAGVAGYLERANEPGTPDDSVAYVFRRTAPGPATPCPAGSLFVPDDAEALADRTSWIWAGNNGVMTASDAEGAAAAIAGMVAGLPHQRFLVLGALPRPDRIAGIALFNEGLRQLYGPRFVDTVAALQLAGDGSADDAADIAQGLVPRSLRVDEVHLNTAGYGVVAEAVKTRMSARGW